MMEKAKSKTFIFGEIEYETDEQVHRMHTLA